MQLKSQLQKQLLRNAVLMHKYVCLVDLLHFEDEHSLEDCMYLLQRVCLVCQHHIEMCLIFDIVHYTVSD